MGKSTSLDTTAWAGTQLSNTQTVGLWVSGHTCQASASFSKKQEGSDPQSGLHGAWQPVNIQQVLAAVQRGGSQAWRTPLEVPSTLELLR